MFDSLIWKTNQISTTSAVINPYGKRNYKKVLVPILSVYLPQTPSIGSHGKDNSFLISFQTFIFLWSLQSTVHFSSKENLIDRIFQGILSVFSNWLSLFINDKVCLQWHMDNRTLSFVIYSLLCQDWLWLNYTYILYSLMCVEIRQKMTIYI